MIRIPPRHTFGCCEHWTMLNSNVPAPLWSRHARDTRIRPRKFTAAPRTCCFGAIESMSANLPWQTTAVFYPGYERPSNRGDGRRVAPLKTGNPQLNFETTHLPALNGQAGIYIGQKRYFSEYTIIIFGVCQDRELKQC